jgi:hypothetical protein
MRRIHDNFGVARSLQTFLIECVCCLRYVRVAVDLDLHGVFCSFVAHVSTFIAHNDAKAWVAFGDQRQRTGLLLAVLNHTGEMVAGAHRVHDVGVVNLQIWAHAHGPFAEIVLNS